MWGLSDRPHTPSDITLSKNIFVVYYNCSVDYLLGRTENITQSISETALNDPPEDKSAAELMNNIENNAKTLYFLGNLRSAVLLVSFALDFAALPCITQSSAAVETLRPAQNILRNTALLRFQRKSIEY